jgi:hypothetical protein
MSQCPEWMHMHGGNSNVCSLYPRDNATRFSWCGKTSQLEGLHTLAVPPKNSAETAPQKLTGRCRAHERQVLSGRPNLDMYLNTSMGSPEAHSSLIRKYSASAHVLLLAYWRLLSVQTQRVPHLPCNTH